MRAFRQSVLAAVSGVALAAALSAGAHAQSDQDRRLDKLEKEVRELRAIVFQGRDTGQPVVVKPEGPDPAVEAIQSKLDQEDQTIRTLSGQVEVLSHDLEEARRQNAAAHDAETELRGEVKALVDQMARAAAPPQPEAPPPPPPADQAVAPATPSESSAFKAAKAKLTAGDYPGASDAFAAYLQQYPASPRAKEAYYWQGEAYFVRSLYGDATTAYARALKDWPKTAWAPDATVKLSRALAATNRPDQACTALGEFDKRYEATAPKAVKARAAATAAAAKCAG
jgi:tol-pal system protein YbgF